MNTSKRTSDFSSPSVVSRPWKLLIKGFPLVIYSFFVIAGAVTPASKIPTIFSRLNDKLIHGAEFFLLFLAAIYALGWETKNRRLIFALTYCAVMGILTETLQYFVPSRSMSAVDFLADAAGFCLSAIFFNFLCNEGKP